MGCTESVEDVKLRTEIEEAVRVEAEAIRNQDRAQAQRSSRMILNRLKEYQLDEAVMRIRVDGQPLFCRDIFWMETFLACDSLTLLRCGFTSAETIVIRVRILEMIKTLTVAETGYVKTHKLNIDRHVFSLVPVAQMKKEEVKKDIVNNVATNPDAEPGN